MSIQSSQTPVRVPVVGLEILAEGTESIGVPALGCEQHAGLVQIHEQRHVVVPAPEARLVDADPADRSVADLLAGNLDV
jgi:hypothetical protein